MKTLTESKFQLGVGWRAELALAISRRRDLDFVEIVAENFFNRPLPEALNDLRQRGVEIIPHCISLAPGSGKRPDAQRIKQVDAIAQKVGATLLSDHLCFVRAANLESGHLLPVPRNRSTLRVVVENIKFIQHHLSVPFALENIASVCDWENGELDEATFFAEVLEQTNCLMLLDVANLYANSINHKFDPIEYLKKLPLHRLAYVHIAGGIKKGRFFHDTHAHPVVEGAFALLQALCRMTEVNKVMLERDDNFPSEFELNAELSVIKHIVQTNHAEAAIA